jgi:hypothetical protein
MFIELTVLFFCLSHFICIVVSRISVGYMQPDYCNFLTQDLLFHFSIVSTTNQSQDSSFGVTMGYLLNGPGLFPGSERFLHSVQTEFWAHPASYPMGTERVK